MEQEAKLLKEIRSPLADAQIVEWQWPSPMQVRARENRTMIEMSLPPFAKEGWACYPDLTPERYSFMGRMFLRPADFTLDARCAGGKIQVVRCAIDPGAFESVLEEPVVWDEPTLRSALHLRSSALASLFALVKKELQDPGLASAALVEAYSTAIVVETVRTLQRSRDIRSTARMAAWQHRRIQERVEQDGPSPSVQELAQIVGVSPRHLLRLYRNLAGESVVSLIERAQIDRAKRLLSNSDLPLKVIASRLGFERPGSFSIAFRRATGASPRAFRQGQTI